QTSSTALLYGFADRGVVAPGKKADLNLVDFDALHLDAPEMVFDLPGGGRRLVQRVDGYVATLVAGDVTYENGEPTGARPARLADPDVDAVYNPLPNGLHAVWTIRALDAGKHVLCEKPFTANATEAERVAAAAERTGLVVMEAFHWRYHPLAQRMVDVVNSGELGTVKRIETWMCFPLLKRA